MRGAPARPCGRRRGPGARRRRSGRTSSPSRARASLRRRRDRRPRARGCRPRCWRPSARRSRTMWSWLSGSYEMLPVTSAFSSPPMRCSRPGRPGDRPRPRERLRVAQVREEVLAGVRRRRELGRDRRQRRDVRDQPRLRAVREVGVREEVHRRAVLERDPGGLDHGVEALGRARAATTGTGAPPLRPNSTISRSACSGFVGIPGRRAGALDVEDQERQLEHDRRGRPSRP